MRSVVIIAIINQGGEQMAETKPKMPRKVLDAINSVRESGVINMFDRPGVSSIIANSGHPEESDWIDTHRSEYASLIFKGPNAFEITD